MSQQSELRYRLGLYRELDDIVGSMRNLARMELIRLKKAVNHQQQVYEACLQALSLVAHFHPGLAAGTHGTVLNSRDTQSIEPGAVGRPVLLILGSERGFCAGFNEQLVRAYETEAVSDWRICTVGSRLGRRLGGTEPGLVLAGPGTLDEVADCAQQVLTSLLAAPRPAAISLLCQSQQGIGRQRLYPVQPQMLPRPPASLQLQLPAGDLYRELQWHCLQQGMVQHMLTSLLMENHQRLEQMERAKSHLEELSQGMQLDLNRLRQQEIIEEIEVLFAEPGIGLDWPPTD
ncbi:F0F1 ATP synthase subunit gamma [Shewanella sp. AS16]|uniref:F0F1 ATP synthase subunit gamma n=1 Tax=Shewanella sp. AS16 TaxID=2907625 RepID=UPI001F27833F|nr:F0F1 ATP synthase subunit gamma [Shewanella sp. AS16]MCE9684797.1 F0F1 ATP synthase subunit gamma [Shewanella sp. AS16]